jgi:hypothetical protein
MLTVQLLCFRVAKAEAGTQFLYGTWGDGDGTGL